MEPAKRIIVNTAAQYVKAIINICLSLYSTRLILDILNVQDYGIYSVVAGVVGILGYLTNALVVTTQRYLSYYHGMGDVDYVRKVFANSLLIHLAIGLLFCVVLFTLQNLVMDHFLNIDPQRLAAAKVVYVITVMMLLMTIVTSPFKASLIARENIVYISVVEMADGVMRLVLAVSLFFIGTDKLIAYAIGMALILVINFFAYVVYVFVCYEESHFRLSLSTVDPGCIRKLMGFAGWTTYGMVAGVCQTQGTAVVLNHFFGTAINAAFGLASQVNGAVRFVSTSVLNAMNPQVMKEEGNGNREKMLRLAGKESKFSAALMMIVSVPIMAEMPGILDFWLREVPAHTAMFCRALMLAFLLDQLTLGLHAANQATGVIRSYSLIMFTPKILIVPAAWIMLAAGCSVESIMWMYVGIELAVAVARLPFMRCSTGLSIRQYLRHNIVPLFPTLLAVSGSSYAVVLLTDIHYRFFLTLMIGGLCGAAAFWLYTLSEGERRYATDMIKSRLHHADH